MSERMWKTVEIKARKVRKEEEKKEEAGKKQEKRKKRKRKLLNEERKMEVKRVVKEWEI